MKVLVCGGREYNDTARFNQVMDELHEGPDGPITHIIHGAARGADNRAGVWAWEHGVQEVACPANWDKQGKGAGMRRNFAMAALQPDMVVAFPGGRGTAMMIKIARDAGIHVLEV